MTLYYRQPRKEWQTTTTDKLDEFIKGYYPREAALTVLNRGDTLYTPKLMITLIDPKAEGVEVHQQQELF